MDIRFDWVEQIGEQITRQSLRAIAEAVDTSQIEGGPIVVFNPTAGPRTDLVTVRVPLPEEVKSIDIVTLDGEYLPCEIVDQKQATREHLNVDRDGLRSALTRVLRDTVGEERVQSIQTSRDGELALVEVTLAPLPSVAGIEDAAKAEVEALLADDTIHFFRLQVSRQAELEVRFVAPEVPGFGYTTVAARPARRQPEPGLPPDSLRLENKFFVVEPDLSVGTLTVTDKRTGAIFPGLHLLVDVGDRGDEYNYCLPEHDWTVSAPESPPTIRLLESSPICQTLEITQTYLIPESLEADRAHRSSSLVPLPVTTRVSLSPGVPRIDFVTTLQNHARDQRLRVHFPASIMTDVSHAEGHFDVVSRSLTLPRDTLEWQEQPVPTSHQRTFVDVNDGQTGLLVANRGLPEYEVIPHAEGVTVALTLLRCVGWLSRDDLHCRNGHAGPNYPTPEAQCLGSHTFAYALVPHRGTWENAFEQAHAFNAPLRGVATRRGAGQLPPSQSFVKAEPSGFVLTAIKLAEDGNGLVVRGYNVTDRPQQVTLQPDSPWSRATRINLAGTPVEDLPLHGGAVYLTVKPKEIVSLRFHDA
jgi:hypothetical protein